MTMEPSGKQHFRFCVKNENLFVFFTTFAPSKIRKKNMKRIYHITFFVAAAITAAVLFALDWLRKRAGDAAIYQNQTVDTMSSNTFSTQSEARLATCDPRLQQLARAVLRDMDVAVLCGHRTEAEQNAAYAAGNSQLRYPNSKHNALPSQAVDLAPYPIDWSNISRFQQMGELAKKKASLLGFAIAWGGDWTAFKDYPHVELA
jgi:hypothetical protein